jgi:hypothetical protein
VVQMVGSRHSSLRLPSITVTATVAPPWSCAGVTSPAGQPSSQASTSGVTRRGTDQAAGAGTMAGRGTPSPRSAGAVDGRRTPPPGWVTLPARGPAAAGVGRVLAWVSRGLGGVARAPGSATSSAAGRLARRMVSSARSDSDHGVVPGGWSMVSAGRMRTSFGVDPPGAGWPCGSGMTPGGEQGLEDRPGWRLASAGVGSRAPGPGTRAGPLQPRGEAGVAAQGGVRMRHGNAGGCPA